MKFLHLGDLHLGKRLVGVSLLEDQRHILEEILSIAESERPDAVLIAGDVYDRTTPPAEAVTLLDDFLTRLSAAAPVVLIAGNHDSAERLAFGGRLMAAGGVHLSPVYDGTLEPVVLRDRFGTVAVWPLPFLRPAHVRAARPDAAIENSTDAVREALAAVDFSAAERHVLLAHQFVTGSAPSGSEEFAVGGVDSVDAAVFRGFDYVALGHIHSAQSAGAPHIRYCGAPLCCHESEAGRDKSVTVAELGENGALTVRELPLHPLRRLRRLRGSYDELSARQSYAGAPVEDYLVVTLTDEQEVPDAAAKLRLIYPNLLRLGYDNTRTRSYGEVAARPPEERAPLELVSALYEQQNGSPPTPDQTALLRRLIREIWEEDEQCAR